MGQSAAIGFIGKLPAQADFVRHGLAERIGGELDRWLQRSQQALQLAKSELPDTTLRFVFSAPGCDAVAIGVLRASRDRVGRSFPLAIFTMCPLTRAVTEFPALPYVHAAFLEAGCALLERAETLTLDVFRSAVLALPLPSESDAAAHAPALLDGLQSQRALELLSQLFPLEHSASASAAYALHTLCMATDAVRGAPGQGAATVLACPLLSAPAAHGGEPSLFAWLELVRRRLSWRDSCPSYIWLDGPSARVLIALGAAPEQMLHFVAAPDTKATRLWPLVTTRPEARVRAQRALPDIESQAARSVDELWTALAALPAHES